MKRYGGSSEPGLDPDWRGCGALRNGVLPPLMGNLVFILRLPHKNHLKCVEGKDGVLLRRLNDYGLIAMSFKITARVVSFG